MGEERLVFLTLLSVHWEMLRDFNAEVITKEFFLEHPHRASNI